jgi:hypothetical protein
MNLYPEYAKGTNSYPNPHREYFLKKIKKLLDVPKIENALMVGLSISFLTVLKVATGLFVLGKLQFSPF